MRELATEYAPLFRPTSLWRRLFFRHLLKLRSFFSNPFPFVLFCCLVEHLLSSLLRHFSTALFSFYFFFLQEGSGGNGGGGVGVCFRGWMLSQFVVNCTCSDSNFRSVCLRVDHPDRDEPPVRVDAFLNIRDPLFHLDIRATLGESFSLNHVCYEVFRADFITKVLLNCLKFSVQPISVAEAFLAIQNSLPIVFVC